MKSNNIEMFIAGQRAMNDVMKLFCSWEVGHTGGSSQDCWGMQQRLLPERHQRAPWGLTRTYKVDPGAVIGFMFEPYFCLVA